jgi:hypothetical protein
MPSPGKTQTLDSQADGIGWVHPRTCFPLVTGHRPLTNPTVNCRHRGDIIPDTVNIRAGCSRARTCFLCSSDGSLKCPAIPGQDAPESWARSPGQQFHDPTWPSYTYPSCRRQCGATGRNPAKRTTPMTGLVGRYLGAVIRISLIQFPCPTEVDSRADSRQSK